MKKKGKPRKEWNGKRKYYHTPYSGLVKETVGYKVVNFCASM